MTRHQGKVSEIARQVSEASRLKKQVRVFHGFSHTTREVTFAGVQRIDMSSLNEVLEVNKDKKYAVVEPSVTMDKLVSETLKKGLIPLVVPEFPKISVGGAIQGGAGESSSFKYGGVHSICDEYEVVLGNGEIVKASNFVNPELFWGMPCSYGSLGITTLAKLCLREAKPFVRLAYIPVWSFSELLQVIQAQVKSDIDFIDAIVFSPQSAVVMIGNLVERAEGSSVTTFSKRSDEWFYLHVFKRIKMRDFSDDLILLTDYLFRYNRGAFWTGKLLFDKLKLPFTRFTRSLFNKYLDVRSIGDLLHAANNSQSGICQDFCLPSSKVLEFLCYLDITLGAYPLWMVPLKPTSGGDKFSPVHLPAQSVINIGVYAKFGGGYNDFIDVNRNLERKLMQLGGRKVLYAHQYFSREEFWHVYDREWYQELREKYFAADVFPDLYDSTHVGKQYQSRSGRAFTHVLRKIVQV